MNGLYHRQGCFIEPVARADSSIWLCAQYASPGRAGPCYGGSEPARPAIQGQIGVRKFGRVTTRRGGIPRPGSPITFQYREELSHDEYHIPLWVSAFDPVTYFGSPLGDFGVTAFASLAIIDANGAVAADYTRRAYVTKSYSLYAEPTHRELEQAARDAVRAKIDQSLYSDSDRLVRILNANPPHSAAASK